LLEAVAQSDLAEESAALLASGYESLGDREEAARWFGKAIERALASGEFERVIELGDHAAKIAKTSADRVRAALWVVDALVREGRAAEAKERLEGVSLEGVGDMGIRLEARVLVLSIAATLRHITADHDPSLVADADAHGDARLRIESRLAVARLVSGRRGLALAEEATTLASGASLDLRYRALAMRLELLIEVDPSDQARLARAVETVRGVARELRSGWAELDADNYFAIALSNAAAFAEAARQFESIAERAKTFKFGTLHRVALVNIATTHLRAGDPARAAAAALCAAETAKAAGDALVLAGALSVRADALFQTNDLVGARDAIDEAVEIALPGRDYRATLALLRRVEILDRLGDAEGAGRDAELARSIADENHNVDHGTRAKLWSALSAARARGAAASGELRAALAESARVEPSLRQPTKRLAEQARRFLESIEPA
jgi:tetratricopeptide (TPR) repeat protein